MTTITANFGSHTESVDVPEAYIEDVIDDFYANGAIVVSRHVELAY